MELNNLVYDDSVTSVFSHRPVRPSYAVPVTGLDTLSSLAAMDPRWASAGLVVGSAERLGDGIETMYNSQHPEAPALSGTGMMLAGAAGLVVGGLLFSFALRA